MIWIPGLSLVIFFLILVPFMIYGYKKGWVYALSFSVVLWLLTLIFIGLNYILYDYLWDLFYKIFLEKKLKVDIDLNNLSKFYKTQVILLVTGIDFVLIYPLTFLIMHFLEKFIKKYFGHKYLPISKSEKEIVARRSISSSRLGGATILTVSTLFSASLVASFANVIIIPHKKSSVFNNINDRMGRIYSLGLTSNPESARIISDFIDKKLDNKLFESMQELTNFQSDETESPNVFPDMKKINYFESKQKDFADLYKNEEATNGIFSSVIAKEKKINPLSFDPNTSVANINNEENTIGYNKTKISNLSFFKSAVNQISIFLPKSLLNFLVKRFSNSFIDFKKTVFHLNYLNAIKNEEDQKKLKLQRRRDLEFLKIKLQNLKKERKDLIEWLETVSGTSYPGADSEFELDSKIDFPVKNVDSASPGNGTFKNELDKSIALKIKSDEKEAVFVDKNNDYESYKRATYDPARDEIRKLKLSYESLLGEIKVLTTSVENLEGQLRDFNLDLKNYKDQEGKLKSKINNLINDRNNAVSNEKKDSISAQINEENKKLADIRSKISRTENDFSAVKYNIDQYKSQISRIRDNADNERNILINKERDFLSIQAEEIKRKNVRNFASKEFFKANTLFKSQRDKVSDLQKKYQERIAIFNQKNNNIVDSKSKIDVLENRSGGYQFVGPAIVWNKADDGSIFYNEEYEKWWKNKKEQLKVIKESKESLFQQKKSEMINLYIQWIRRGSDED